MLSTQKNLVIRFGGNCECSVLRNKIERKPLWVYFRPKTPYSHFHGCVEECSVTATKDEGKREVRIISSVS